MDKSSLIRLYKKYTKQKHRKYSDEQIKENIESLSAENQQIVFDLICISPSFQTNMINQEEKGFSVEWNNIPFEIKEVIQVYLEKLQ